MTYPEKRNPFFFLLMIASFLFAITALAYAVIPTLEQKASEFGQDFAPSAFRDRLRESGWKWLLIQLGGMILFGILSMVLDRIRTLNRQERTTDIECREKR